MRAKPILVVFTLFSLSLLLTFQSPALIAHTTAADPPPIPWQALPGPTGGAVSHVARVADPHWSGPIFIALPGQGIYRSQTDGFNWSPTGAGNWIVVDLTLSPQFDEDATLFALTGSWQTGYAVRRSQDGGQSWQTSNAFPNGLALAVSPNFSFDQTVYALTGQNQATYISTDGGENFSLADGWFNGRNITALAFSPDYAVDNVLFAIVPGDGLYQSTDSGASWNAAGLEGDLVALAVSPNFAADEKLLALGADGAVHLSSDGGANWTTADITLDSDGRFSIAFSPSFAADQTIMIASSTDPGPYRSLDGGASWTPAGWYDPAWPTADGLLGGGVQALVLSPGQGEYGVVHAATRAGMARSTNRGGSWSQINKGLPALAVRAVASAPEQPELMLAGSAYFERLRFDSGGFIPDAGAIHRSTDGGQTWRQVSGRLARLNALAFSPNFAADQTVFAAAGMVGQHGFEEGGLYRSTDGGQHWTAVAPLPLAYTALAVSPHYAVDRAVWAAATAGLYRTVDGGDHWTLIAPSLRATALAVSPNFAHDQTLFAATQNGGAQRSLDGGLTWSQSLIAPEVTALAISPVYGASRALYAAARTAWDAPTTLFRSRDGGDSWQPLPGAIPAELNGRPAHITALTFAVDGSVVAAVQYGPEATAVYRAIDGGENWLSVGALAPGTAVNALASLPAHSLNLYAAANSGLHSLYLPQSGPAEPGSWRGGGPRGGIPYALAVSPQFATDGVAFAGSYMLDYLDDASGSGVVKSVDHGQSWSPSGGGLADYPNSAGVMTYAVSANFAADQTVFMGAWGGLFRSTDGGANWTRLETPNMGEPSFVSRIALAPDFSVSGCMMIVSGYDGYLFISEDGGQSWRNPQLWPPGAAIGQIADTVNIADIVYSPAFAVDQTLYVSGIGGVWRSTDGGVSWLQMRQEYLTAVTLSPNFANDQTVWGGTDFLYRSTDGGETWAEYLIAEGAYLRRLVVSPGYAEDQALFAGTNIGLYWSGDGGLSWTAVPEYTDETVISLAISPQWPNHPLVLVGGITGVSRLLTVDLPIIAWRQASQGLTLLSATALALSPDESLLLAGARNHGVYGSQDKGNNWRPQGLQLAGYYNLDGLLFSPNYSQDETIFAYSSSGIGVGGSIYRSRDAGVSWDQIHHTDYVSSVAISPDYAADQTLFSTASGFLFRSTDQGDSWEPVAGWQPDIHGQALVIALPPDYPDDGRLLLGGSDGFWLSADGGASWTPAATGLGDGRHLLTLRLSPNFAADGTLLAMASWPTPDDQWQMGFFRSTNGGLDWTPIMDGLPILQPGFTPYRPLADIAFSPEFAADETLYALTAQAVYRSSDSGDGWRLVGAPPERTILNRLLLDGAGRLYVASEAGVWRYHTLHHNLIVNGDFEGRAGWSFPATPTPGGYATQLAYNGRAALRLGLDNDGNQYGYSSGRQIVNLPADTRQATLTFHLYPVSGEATTAAPTALAPYNQWLETSPTTAGDAQYALLIDAETADILEIFYWGLSNEQAWRRHTVSLPLEYSGRPLLIHFGVFNDGLNGRTALYVDDVSLIVLTDSLAAYHLHLPLVQK